MIPIVIPAYAKINLAIDILGKDDNNYHQLDMVSVPVLLHDTIELSVIKNSQYKDAYIYCDDPKIECDETNTAYQAFSLFKDLQEAFDLTYKIFIYKRIPVQAGLGGGSSDAAAVLKALQQHINNKVIITDDIINLAKKIGADVPFSLYNKPSRVQGIGEKLEPINIKTKYNVLLINPGKGLSTKYIYTMFDKMKAKKVFHRPNITELINGLENDNEELISKNLINVLTDCAVKELPLIKDILDKLKEYNLNLSGMSGTGSSCFALSKDKCKLKRVRKLFESLGCSTIITKFNI